MTTAQFLFDEIGPNTTGVHALHDNFVQQVEDLLGAVLTLSGTDGTVIYTPTAAQAVAYDVYKFDNDGTTPPASDTGFTLDVQNFPTRTFSVWNNMTVPIVIPRDSTASPAFNGNVGCGVMPGRIARFYFDGSEVHPLSITEGSMQVVKVNAVGTQADVGGSYTGAYAGVSFGGITLTWDDWVLVTDYKWVFRAGAASGDVRGYHPSIGDPVAGDTSNPDTYGVIVYCTEGTYAGTYWIFDGTSWVQAPYAMGAAGGSPINMGGFYPGTPGTSTLIWEAVVTENIEFPDDFANSEAFLRTAPSGGAISFDVAVNGTDIGNFDFADATATATFATDATTVSLTPGDRISVSSPADLRSAANLSWMFKGTRTP